MLSKPTAREEKIYKLRNKAQVDSLAMMLFRTLELECNMILDSPNSAPESVVRAYNRIVKGSGLSFADRQELLMEEKR